MNKFAFLFSISALLLLSWSKETTAQTKQLPSLKETFKNDFLIGTALNTQQIEEKDTAADRLVKRQFNTVTPENVMKAEIIHPSWNTYDFEFADKLVAFSVKNNITINAHTLIW